MQVAGGRVLAESIKELRFWNFYQLWKHVRLSPKHMEIKKNGSHLKTNAECLCAWAMLSKDFNGWGVASLNFIQGQTTGQMGIYICICAHPGNIHYTKNTLQKPPSMLNQIQFGNSRLYCVVKALKKREVLWHLVFVLTRSHIANWWNQRLAENFQQFFVSFWVERTVSRV